jgi:hypothetical protein
MRTLIVGDIHGCAEELEALLTAVDFAAGSDRLLLTGDAFARGPDPLGVWEQISAYRAKMVLGNHDARLRQQLGDLLAGDDPGRTKPDQRYALRQLAPVQEALHAWLMKVPLYLEEDAFLLVHAGINPEHGLAGTRFEEFITIRTWPPVSGSIEGPRWHDYYEPSDHSLLIFGHDAPGGLVVKRRHGDLYLLGLDTGCVYGGALTGYLVEEDRLVEVTSRQAPNAWKERDA